MPSFSERHRQHLLARDADAVADLYHDDASMLSFEFGARDGREAIRDQYADFFEFHGAIDSVSPDREVEHDGSLFTEFTLQSERGAFQLINAFVLDGGKARRHFSNVVSGKVEADESEG